MTNGDGASAGGQSGIARRRSKAAAKNSAEFSRRRQRLLDVAAHLFKERGLAAVKIAEIAEAAGIDRANVYYYARSKEDLYLQVLLAVKAEAVTNADTVARSDRSPKERLRTLMIELMKDMVNQYPYLYLRFNDNLDAIAVQFPDDPRVEEVVRLTERHFAAFRKVVRDGMKEGTFSSALSSGVLTEAAIGVITHSINWYDPAKVPLSGQVLGEALADLFLDGLCTT
jgi:AcrR family transcriptional regulator